MPKADNVPPSCAVVTKSGSLNFLGPSGPVQAYNGTAATAYERNRSPIKEVLRLFSIKYYYHELTKISKFQSNHYINVSTDPPGTGRASQGTREGLLGNRLYRDTITLCSKEPQKS